MRIRDWRIVLLFLLACGFIESSFAISNNPNVIIPQNNDPVSQRNFQNVYSVLNSKSSISTGSGAPASAPAKIGDIYIDTVGGKVYVSISSFSFAILN